MNCDHEHYYTYNELAIVYGVSLCTIGRWFRDARKFKPTRRTVRIPESELIKFRKRSTT